MNLPSIPHDELRARTERLEAMLRDRGLDAAVVHAAPLNLGHATRSSGSVTYLSGWRERFYPSLMVVPRDGAPTLLVLGSPLDTRWLAGGAWFADVRVASSAAGIGADARAILDDRGVAPDRLGIAGADEMFLSTADALFDARGRAAAVAVDDLLADLKGDRSAAEVDLQSHAAAISDAMIARGFERAAEPDAWAHAVMAEMEFCGRSRGADFASSWVAWGEAPTFVAHQIWQAAEPLSAGERVQVGTYVVLGGYWAHAIRVATLGAPSSALRDAHQRVLDLQDTGLDALVPGASLREAVQRLQARAESHRLGLGAPDDAVLVRFGHALGVQYAEPRYSDAFPHGAMDPPGGDVELAPGMIFELHPNLSVPGLGWVTAGDMALVTPSGARWLTAAPREIVEL